MWEHCCGKSVSRCRGPPREFRVSVTLIDDWPRASACETGAFNETFARRAVTGRFIS